MAKLTKAVGSNAMGWTKAGERKWLISRVSKREFHDCMNWVPGSITQTATIAHADTSIALGWARYKHAVRTCANLLERTKADARFIHVVISILIECQRALVQR
eukprot:scaffold7165_cov115-Isochrysis_galbana.AAC.3